MARWKLLRAINGKADAVIARDFSGTAEDALREIARRAAAEPGAEFFAASEGEPEPDALPAGLATRELRRRPDGRGWNLLTNEHGHAGWHQSARGAVGYERQRARPWPRVVLIHNREGRLTQFVLLLGTGRAHQYDGHG